LSGGGCRGADRRRTKPWSSHSTPAGTRAGCVRVAAVHGGPGGGRPGPHGNRRGDARLYLEARWRAGGHLRAAPTRIQALSPRRRRRRRSHWLADRASLLDYGRGVVLLRKGDLAIVESAPDWIELDEYALAARRSTDLTLTVDSTNVHPALAHGEDGGVGALRRGARRCLAPRLAFDTPLAVASGAIPEIEVTVISTSEVRFFRASAAHARRAMPGTDGACAHPLPRAANLQSSSWMATRRACRVRLTATARRAPRHRAWHTIDQPQLYWRCRPLVLRSRHPEGYRRRPPPFRSVACRATRRRWVTPAWSGAPHVPCREPPRSYPMEGHVTAI